MAAMGARRALERTIEYLRVREAFGKPLLANQYLQYNLAELIAEVDLLMVYNREAAAHGSPTARTSPARRPSPSSRSASSPARSPTRLCSTTAAWATPRRTGPPATCATSRLISIGGGADEVMLRILSLLEGMGET